MRPRPFPSANRCSFRRQGSFPGSAKQPAPAQRTRTAAPDLWTSGSAPQRPCHSDSPPWLLEDPCSSNRTADSERIDFPSFRLSRAETISCQWLSSFTILHCLCCWGRDAGFIYIGIYTGRKAFQSCRPLPFELAGRLSSGGTAYAMLAHSL